MTETPPLLPRRPRPSELVDPNQSPPITLETKVPHRVGTFRSSKKGPKEGKADTESSPAPTQAAPKSPKFTPEAIFPSFANPTYLLMSTTNRDGCSSTELSAPDFSDTDSIMFLEKTAPNLVRNGVRRSSGGKQSPPRFSHVYEDVPEHVIENNRKIVASRDIFDSVSFESPLNSEYKRDSSESSNSSYDFPRQTSLPETFDNPVLLAQRQLSASGCFYDFPTFQRRKVAAELGAANEEKRDEDVDFQTYDIPASLGSPPPSLGRQDIASNSLYDFPLSSGTSPLLSRSPSEEHLDTQPPSASPPRSSSPKEIVGSRSPPAFLQANLENPAFKASYAYEVPKTRPVLGRPCATVAFPPPPPVSLLYDIPSQLATSPTSQLVDVLEDSPEDYDTSQFSMPLTPPPSYPPPPPPVLAPPAVPPRNIPPGNVSKAEGPIPGFRPVPAKRYSLARQSPVPTTPPSTVRRGSPDPSGARDAEENRSPAVSRSSSTREPTRPQQVSRLSSIVSDSGTSPGDDVVPPLWGVPKECQPSSFDSASFELSALEEVHGKFSDSSTPCESFEWKGASSSPTCDDGEKDEDPFDEEPRRRVSESMSSCAAAFTISTAKWNEQRDFAGYIYKTGAKRKGFLKRWSTLQDGCWSYFVSQKDSLPLGSLSVQDIGAVSVTGSQPCPAMSDHPELWCFEIHALQCQGRQFLIGVESAPLRDKWINKLTTVVAPSLPVERNGEGMIEGVSHVGRLHVKEGVGGFWQTTVVCLQGRQLHLQAGQGAAEVVDLRKVMSVGKSGSLTFAGAHEAGPSFQLQLPGRTIYMQADHPRHTESWAASVECAWSTPPDPAFSDLYLAPDGIPVAIDRCLNYISTYGTMLTGIYRLAGSSSRVKKLVELMQQSPWSLHLTTDDYTPHDVANALKRYLRSFPDCLLTKRLFQRWIGASRVQHPAERRKVIKNLLGELPTTNFQLLKKLICHLKSISDRSDKNYMPILNLAPVFGPSLLYGEVHRSLSIDVPTASGSFEENNASMDIIADLIHGYCSLFEVEQDEIEKEKKIQEALNLFRDCKVTQRPAGDILVGVYVYSRDWGHCLNMKLSPAMTATDLCRSAISQVGMKESLSNLAVFEIVCNKDLERPLHYTESVLASALRWAAWDSFYAKENYLCIKNNFVYEEIGALVQSHRPLSVFSELKYASPRQKSFKKVHFEFTRGKITHHKDAKASQQLNQWNIEDVTWYLGCDSRRSPPHRMNITFVPRQGEIKKTRDAPYFGHCLSLPTEDECSKWLAAMLIAEYPTGVLPAETAQNFLD
ncbi:uncharacterized protein LOC135394898 [Ornithodoros turicata]|uniref:uncharacterized protein LOC135394898 n=1 Tax=Ornithodoros turicata TaxID=34597 RepID=UPI0031398189